MNFIERVGQSIKRIEANYERFDDTAFNDGGVGEYTVIVHKKLLKEIIELFRAIAEYPDLFNREFSTNQMNRISRLARNLVSDQYNGSVLNDDGNRSLISRMRVVFGEKKASQYKSEADKLQALMVRVEDMLKKEESISSMKEVIEGIKDQLDGIAKNQKEAQQGLEEVQNKNTEVGNVLNDVNTKHEEIGKKYPAIVDFFEEVVQNQKDLKKLETENTDFVQEMKENEAEYEKNRAEHLQKLQVENTEFFEELKKNHAEYSEKIDGMLVDAKNMLDPVNSAGLAGAFNQRIIKGEKKKGELWLAGALVFIIGAIVIALLTNGVNIDIPGFSISDNAFSSIWARISITTMPLLAAYFCAAQYLKLERTLEDYEYKKALAQSMPVFMDQLGKGNEECRAYLSLALQQMLQDPLRKKHDVPFLLKDLFEKASENLSKSITFKKKTPNDTTSEKKDDKP